MAFTVSSDVSFNKDFAYASVSCASFHPCMHKSTRSTTNAITTTTTISV